MERISFIFILLFLQSLRWVLGPVLILILFPFSKKIQQRWKFELQNFTDSPSFKDEGKKANVAFEVSSEGELEQIRPLLNSYLDKGELVELIYSSTSLENKIAELSGKKPTLRSLRLPALTCGPFHNRLFGLQNINEWLTAPTLILCRYDFFPELLLYGIRKENRFCLLSATLKNKKKSWWLQRIYHSFDSILATSEEDKNRLESLGVKNEKIRVYEFRILQIFDRLEKGVQKLLNYKPLTDYLDSFSRQNRIIIGSAWPVELDILKNSQLTEVIRTGEKLLIVLPHLFNNDIRNRLSSMVDLPVYSYKEGESLVELIDLIKERPGILILEVKGILLELYQFFGHAIVGGGYGRSVHSLLEPYLAGCHIYCGPKTHRSTEYDFINYESPQDIDVLNSPEDFFRVYKDVESTDLLKERKKMRESYLSCFNQQVQFVSGELR